MRKCLSKLKKTNLVRQLTALIFWTISLLPVKKKTILFESFSGKQYSCNPKAIYEYMKEQGYSNDMIWSANGNIAKEFEKNNIPYVKRFSLQWFLFAPRAQYWITNSRMPSWIPKPKHTKYVQTWHGTPLKRLVADMDEVHMAGSSKEEYIKNFHNESSHWDYLISPNHYSTEIFKRAFNFNKKVLETGYPRNDFLVKMNNEEDIKRIKQRMGILLEKKIILYAPTWRDNEYIEAGKYTFQLKLDLNLLKKNLGEDCIVILRLHYFISNSINIDEFEGFVIDYSNHSDINELYLISDLLITDYSSVFFDYANLKRPMIFYMYDLELYQHKLRGFYLNIESDVPGPIVTTTTEVIEWIDTFLFRQVKGLGEDPYHDFIKRFCSLEDGRASERVVRHIFE
ncbi:CDP-glycerol glycerophosphotransferase family protein [Alkalihalobacillus trypoxylicola]|uniref:CDP-glycerol--glycerophosphate glycerophosphotransferase n=1 Tax=Alkalihalobacillus trypoxylicola TaxID=519424 RepID=A0A161PEC6_9BACI|nr:CDP-glycerol glycerophosphotransferase family protein [Alkalihalobacillus trypoxylicola]KYG30880.1 CDP-glycerol--glycerophosphate glycerophosphotransferase [Alkalihalobacillus trypoxylicola]